MYLKYLTFVVGKLLRASNVIRDVQNKYKKSGDFHKPPHSTINLKLIAMNNKESLYRHFYLRHFYNVI